MTLSASRTRVKRFARHTLWRSGSLNGKHSSFSALLPPDELFRPQASELMARAPRCPHGAWPEEMTSDFAAGLTGEPSVEAFLRKVDLGIYPQPRREQGTLDKWHISKLRAAIARRHGLRPDALAEDIADLI